uniref:PH domain-containing protein n=1 Tax=Compsopogon caeruleus TaxID=31354 RepID=A0A6T6CBZ6_9RHOD|mmetsp:Transcript_6046/g.11861  ORF Transcript_6046/g.11861 Transcript_6046/m.11861 type:complete len:451 (+) Transcript_6046:287-1639(+)
MCDTQRALSAGVPEQRGSKADEERNDRSIDELTTELFNAISIARTLKTSLRNGKIEERSAQCALLAESMNALHSLVEEASQLLNLTPAIQQPQDLHQAVNELRCSGRESYPLFSSKIDEIEAELRSREGNPGQETLCLMSADMRAIQLQLSKGRGISQSGLRRSDANRLVSTTNLMMKEVEQKALETTNNSDTQLDNPRGFQDALADLQAKMRTLEMTPDTTRTLQRLGRAMRDGQDSIDLRHSQHTPAFRFSSLRISDPTAAENSEIVTGVCVSPVTRSMRKRFSRNRKSLSRGDMTPRSTLRLKSGSAGRYEMLHQGADTRRESDEARLSSTLWLRKRFPRKRWRRFYATIVPHGALGAALCLFRFDRVGSVLLKRAHLIGLRGVRVSKFGAAEVDSMRRPMFSVFVAGRRSPYVFATHSEASGRRWMDRVVEASQTLRDQKLVDSVP